MSKSARPAKAEISAMKHVLSVTERDEERTSETPIGESLRRLAKKGDMEAALVLEEMDSPMACIRDALLDEALEFDPHWSKLPDGSYRCRQDGAHRTPEALVAAFVDAAGDDLWAIISDETREKIGREALRMDPESFHGTFNLGHVLELQGAYEEAVVHLRHAVDLNPNHAVALGILARVLANASDEAARPAGPAARCGSAGDCWHAGGRPPRSGPPPPSRPR